MQDKQKIKILDILNMTGGDFRGFRTLFYEMEPFFIAGDLREAGNAFKCELKKILELCSTEQESNEMFGVVNAFILMGGIMFHNAIFAEAPAGIQEILRDEARLRQVELN